MVVKEIQKLSVVYIALGKFFFKTKPSYSPYIYLFYEISVDVSTSDSALICLYFPGTTSATHRPPQQTTLPTCLQKSPSPPRPTSDIFPYKNSTRTRRRWSPVIATNTSPVRRVPGTAPPPAK